MDDKVVLELDGATFDALSRLASARGHSVEAEAADIVRNGIDARRRRAELVEEFRRIRDMTPKGVRQTPAVELIREDRDR